MKTAKDLRPTQLDIIHSLVDNPDRMIFAGMGAGKTAAFLTAFDDLQHYGDVRRGIMLAPPIPAAQVWPREPSRWEHLQHLNVEFIDGTPAARKKRLLASTADLVVISLYQTKWLNGVLEELPEDHELFGLLGVDEISRFRGPRSKLARALEPSLHRFGNRWGLTGTLKPNGYEDLFKPFEFITGGDIWSGATFDEWRMQNFMPLDYHGYNWKIHRFAKPVIDELVGKWTTAITVDLETPELRAGPDWDIEIDLAPDAREAYDEMLKHFAITEGEDEEDFVAVAGSAAIQSGKLSQLTQGFVYAKEIDDEGEENTVVAAYYEDAKMAALLDELEGHPDEPVIICYQYKTDLERLLAAFGEDCPYIGSGVSKAKRLEYVEDFSNGKLPKLLVHPAAMGHGVDGLQFGGRYFLWYSLPWSGEQYDQTIKRLDRPGQTKPVISKRLVANGTVDLIKRARVEGKGEEQEAFKLMLTQRGLI